MEGTMLNALAQTTYYYSSPDIDNGNATGLALFGGAFLIVWLVVLVVMVVSMWKLFEKAGVEGWKAIIPVYNGWVLAEIAGKPGWWGIVGVAGIIPLLGIFASLAAFVLYILIAIELVKAFGKEPVYAALLILLPVVGFPWLAFSDAKYTKPATAK
jgi:hypothetical protein